jgi:hypothetical protein
MSLHLRMAVTTTLLSVLTCANIHYFLCGVFQVTPVLFIREFYICEIPIFADIYHYLATNTRLSEVCIFEVSSDIHLPILTRSNILLINIIITLSSVEQNVQEQNIYHSNTTYRNKELNYTKICYSIRNN